MDLNFLNNLSSEISGKFRLLAPIGSIVANGSVHRFDSTKQGDKAVWVCIYQNEYKGNIYYNAIYGNWREGVQYSFSNYGKEQKQSKEFQRAVKENAKITQQKLEQEKQEKYKICRDKWTPYYYGLPADSPVHEYLKNKKIFSNFHARVDKYNVLIIPGWNAKGEFVGAQRIFLDPVTNKFEKKYTFGIEKKGSFCPFGDIRNAEIIYICEGFATACSVYMAFKNVKNVAVASVWDTSNLLDGAQAIRQINPNSYLVFAADNDVHEDPQWHNIGERKAKYASNKISNSLVKTVKFSTLNSGWSDYNDLHQFEGLDQVAKQLHVDTSEFIEIIPMGFNEDKYYYYSSSKKQILEFSKSDHNQTNFLLNAPSKYWGNKYGFVRNSEGEKTEHPDWKKVITGLGEDICKKGVFNHSKVRGLGAWSKNNEIIVNIGDKLFYSGEFYQLYNNGLDTDYFYQSTDGISIDFTRPLGNSDTIKIVEAFQMLNYKNKSDFIILLGWIFSAQIFAALPWRPHIWFTGPRGSGKSTILGYVSEMINLSIMVQGSTAAGIRQRIKNNAIPIIYDESEPDTERARERMSEVIEMARQSSTRSNYEILRGSASGRSLSYNTNACFCMGSIQIPEMNDADVSRFFIIEMKDIKNQNHESFIRLENAMNDIKHLSTGLFVRAVLMYDTHISNINLAKQVIKDKKIESRQADQLAPIIAGYWSYFSTGDITKEFVIKTIDEMKFESSDYAELNNDDDESLKCLIDIFDIQIPGKLMTIGQVIEKYRTDVNQLSKRDYDQWLGMVGIRYDEGENNVYIHASSSYLKKQMEKNSKFVDYKNILRRHKFFDGFKKCRIDGIPRNTIIIRLDY